MSADPLLADLPVRALEAPDAADLLAHLPAMGGTAWLRHGAGMVGAGVTARLDPGAGPDRFVQAARSLAELFDETGPDAVAFASFTFDPRSSGSTVVVPERVVRGRVGRGARSTEMRLLREPPTVTDAGSSLSQRRWLDAVDRAVAEIRAGHGEDSLCKVVLARDLHVEASRPLDARVLLRRLAARFPDCRAFLVDGLLGATPELLIRRTGREVASLVLAGSAPRGEDPQADARLGAELHASGKNRVEHQLAVRSLVDALEPRCRALTVDPQPRLLRLHNVAHLATSVRGTLAESATALELAAALHPTAAVCGTPTPLALERIRALEEMDRGRYSGPVGWVDARGDGEFGIALRCAELTPVGARLFAGAGIVADSVPEAELDEVHLKLRAVHDALGAS